MPINPDQSRMARAAIDIGLTEVSLATGLSSTTISQFEQRIVSKPRAATLAILEGLFGGFVIFVEPTAEHDGGVLLKPGMTAGSWREDAPVQEIRPVDDAGTQLLEYWRARPEDWAGLPMEARAAMLMTIYGKVPEADPISG